MDIVSLMIGFGVALLLCAAVGASLLWRNVFRRLRSLEESMQQIETGERHTHSTYAGLEDAIIALSRYRIENELNAAWLDRATEILQATSQGPKAYDPNQPTGDKVCGRARYRPVRAEKEIIR